MPGTLFPSGLKFPQVVESKAANWTLTKEDTGKVYLVGAADLVATLPAAASTPSGTTYTFIVTAAGLSAGTGFSISPAAADAIAGLGLTSVDDKDLINSGATDAEGDCVTVVCDAGDAGEQGWYAYNKTGTWAKQA